MGGVDSGHRFPTDINGKVIRFQREYDFQYLMEDINLFAFVGPNESKGIVPFRLIRGFEELLHRPPVGRLFVDRIENQSTLLFPQSPEVSIDYH